MCGGGGSSGPQYSEVQQTTTTLPEYAEPYYKDLLARTGYQTSLPYESYPGQRLEWFTPAQTDAMNSIADLAMSGTPETLGQSSDLARSVGNAEFNPNISTNARSSYRAGSPTASYSRMGMGQTYNPGAIDEEAHYRPDQLNTGTGYAYGQRGVGFEPGRLDDQEMLDDYMNPYFQNVVDIQKREAARQADIRHRDTGLESAGAGSLGGYREGIMRSETERNLAEMMDDIQQEGSYAALQDARQSFEADRVARAQQEQFFQSQFGMNEEAKARAADLVQQGFSLNEAAKQAQAELGMGLYSTAEAAQQARQRMLLDQYGMDIGQNQFAAELEMTKYQASEAARQQAAALGLQAAQINQAGEVAAMQAELQFMQSQEANRLAAAGLLSDNAAMEQGLSLDALNAMLQVGGMEQQLLQQGHDIGYQDWARQQAYPIEMLGLYSNILQGASIAQGQTTAYFQQQPTAAQQWLGGGLGALGAYNSMRGG